MPVSWSDIYPLETTGTSILDPISSVDIQRRLNTQLSEGVFFLETPCTIEIVSKALHTRFSEGNLNSELNYTDTTIIASTHTRT